MRPSWHIDLKWMLGLTACILIIASGLLFSLQQLTKRDTAVPLAGALISAGINDRVSDQEFAQVQAAAAANPSATVAVSPLSLSFTGSDIAGLDKKGASAVLGDKVASLLYDNGSETAKGVLAEPPAGSDKGAITLGPTTVLTADNNSLFTTMFIATAAAALVLLGGVAALGRGFGRLGAPAFIAAIGSAPLALLWVAANKAIGPGDPTESGFTHSARLAFNGVSGDLQTTFVAVTAAAVGLTVLALFGGLISAVGGGGRPKEVEVAPAPAPAPPAPPQPAVPSAPQRVAVPAYRASGTPQGARVSGTPQGAEAEAPHQQQRSA